MTPQEIFAQLRRGHEPAGAVTDYPFVPLTAPGMPPPGDDFLAAARSLSVNEEEQATLLSYLYRRALYDADFQLPVLSRGHTVTTRLIPGHRLGDSTDNFRGGPRPAEVMVIGKNPGREEYQRGRNLVGPTSTVFFEALQQLGVSDRDYAEWYIANLVRWPQLNRNSEAIPNSHIKDCAPLLAQELRLIRPRFILCLGADAAKHLLGGSVTVSSMAGRVVDHTFLLNVSQTEPPRYHTCKLMVLVHPAQVYRRPELSESFANQLAIFLRLIRGEDVQRNPDVRYIDVYKASHLDRIVDGIRNGSDPLRRIIAVDAEWNGQHPTDRGAYLRTIQFSAAHGEAYNVVLRYQHGEPAFQPSIEHAICALSRLLKSDPDAGWCPQIGGHFFRADLPWLLHEGLDLRAEYAPPEQVADCRSRGGWDTGLMYHAYNEATSYRLTDVQLRLTDMPVYDTAVKDAAAAECARLGVKRDDLEGYGFLPEWLLHPYGSADADVTRRVAIRCMEPGGLLDRDWNGNSCWEAYYNSHIASLAFLEMEQYGLFLDRNRVDSLVVQYMDVHARLLAAFRQQINWPTFNPASQPQCVAFLFGDHYVQSRRQDATPRAIRPDGAMCLGLRPIKSTGKRSRLWDQLVARGEAGQHSPSVDKETLGILGHQHPTAMMLRDLKFIQQVLQGPLRRPVTDRQSGVVEHDGDYFAYDAGIVAFVSDDGRVRTHFSQVKETGRAGSGRPPLQNLSSRRESDYRRIAGSMDSKDRFVCAYGPPEARDLVGPYFKDVPHIFDAPCYSHPIRSIFAASPGYVFVEVDLSAAEVAVLAWLSGDIKMIEQVRRASLPEDHPEYMDIHADTAVRVFRLQCKPTKKGLTDIGKASLRVAAKNVRFGIPYGRSAEAISRQCREEGVAVSEAECQEIIDFFFHDYPAADRFLRECRERSQGDRWLVGSYGRFRRFFRTFEDSVVGEQERQAQNFPIQNTVADAVQRALYNFRRYRDVHGGGYRLLLQIHDAILFEVPEQEVKAFVSREGGVLQTCLVDWLPIYPRRLNNTIMPVAQPYRFGYEYKLAINWGDKFPAGLSQSLGLSE